MMNDGATMKTGLTQGLLGLAMMGCGMHSSVTLADTQALAVTCNACHQPSMSAATGAPALAGQHAFYIRKQLDQWQNGERGAHPDDPQGALMAAQAKELSDADKSALAAYFSEQAPVFVDAPSVEGALLDQGRRLYIGSCGACHGPEGEGNPVFKAPALNLLRADYIRLQLNHFQNGIRGTTKSDKPGRQMAMMTRSLSEADMAAVAAYIEAKRK